MLNPIVEAEAMGILTRASNRLAAIADHVTESDFLSEFLQLKVSPNTRRTYAQCLDDFFIRLAQVHASIEIVREFLSLSQFQAIALALKYQSMLVEAGLAPATINTRISAVKSLVVATCNHKSSGLQSSRFWDHISCNYPVTWDRIKCN